MLISDALELCKKCPEQGGKGCRIADFQSGKKEEYKYQLPACILGNKKNTAKEKGTPPQKTKQSTLADIKKIRTVDVPWQWDKLDSKIIEAILDKYNKNKIAHIVQEDKSTVRYRIKRMVDEGLIASYDMHTGLRCVKLYNLTPKARKLLNKPEGSPEIQKPKKQKEYPFSSHKNTLIFPVLEGKIPTSGTPYKMNNWTGHVFNSADGSHTIRTTTKSIIVDVNIDIGNHSVANLILKYGDLAKTFAGKFEERYNLKLGTPEWHRDSDCTIKDNAISQLVTEIGSFRTEKGVSLDSSRSSGDMEFPPDMAMGFEDMLNYVPGAIAQISSKIDKIQSHHGSTTERANNIDTGIKGVSEKIDGLSILAVTLLENHDLKQKIKDNEGVTGEIRTELAALQKQFQQMGFGADAPQKQPNKWGFDAYA